MGSQGPEGAADDDWQLVDCQEFTVNLFTAGNHQYPQRQLSC